MARDEFVNEQIKRNTELAQSADTARNSLNLLEQAFKTNKARADAFNVELKNVSNTFKDEFSKSLQKAIRDGGGFHSVFDKARVALEDLALKVGVVNPLSNILFGTNNPTTSELSQISSNPSPFGGGLAGELIQGLASLFGARAFGGPVNAGNPYMVGERGPEMFVPQTAGRIVPNAAQAGVHITMNISTPDAHSFRASQTQIAANMLDAARRAQRIR